MWDDKDENIGSLSSFGDVWNGDDIVRNFDARQVLDVLVTSVDDLCQLLALHNLLEDPHVDLKLNVS